MEEAVDAIGLKAGSRGSDEMKRFFSHLGIVHIGHETGNPNVFRSLKRLMFAVIMGYWRQILISLFMHSLR